jgi:aryl-alcohol dehydrogenase-like predicted oxidoreductase
MTNSFQIAGELTVHRLGFGAMRLTDWDPVDDNAPSVAVARRAIELGVTLIDTADSYDLGANEELLARALRPYSDGLVIATKAGQSRPTSRQWVPLGRPEYLKQQAEVSLRRLRLSHLDLFQLHRVDPQVPLEDQIGALRELQEAGTIRHIGLSEVSVPQIERAREIAPIASVQNLYNLSNRRHEQVLEYCERHAIAFLPWLPLANGAHATASGPLAEVATELDATPVQVSLAWLLARSPVIVPIPGTSSMKHLEENMNAAGLRMSRPQYERLSSIGLESTQ